MSRLLGFQHPLSSLGITALIIFYATTAFASSVLESLERASESVVTVRALRSGVFKDERGLHVAQASSQGSGVVVGSGGWVVTNAHTVGSAKRLEILTAKGESRAAQIVETLPAEDLTLLRFDNTSGIPALELAEDAVKLNQTVYTVGGSEVLKGTISQGRVTGIGEKISEPEGGASLVRVSFNVYAGDSGTPVFDAEGKLVGIMAAGRARTDRVSFAVPSTRIHELLRRQKAQ